MGQVKIYTKVFVGQVALIIRFLDLMFLRFVADNCFSMNEFFLMDKFALFDLFESHVFNKCLGFF